MCVCSGSSGQALPDIDLDFEDVTPGSEDERIILERASDEFDKAPELIKLLTEYKGCEEYIREALSHPGEKSTEKKAWKRVTAAVEDLHEFYEFSSHFSEFWPDLVEAICTDDPMQSIGNNMALVKQIALVFDFTFHFDVEKIMNPHIQNDFAYYRRVLGRMKSSNKKQKLTVDEDTANKMSFFFAYPTPMMKVIIDLTVDMCNEGNVEEFKHGLATLANACVRKALQIMDSGVQEGAENQSMMLYLCALTGCIILVDHLNGDMGAFRSKSPIAIRKAVEMITEYGNYESTNFLINSLRFTTIHLNDEETLPIVKKLLTSQ
eukprot:TRINITY_DN13336_c0_g1_i1.p1 TRINITY_DN13336_c0_g1~~TRINITY_DN13336_c0_g1_i1.p1  ORF type:complete len:321 (+),score=75.76 TRINITY_DN13336_c0_g1_i1:32-994(+)